MLNLNLHFTLWDGVLLGAVSLMGTAMAYLHHPRWKAVIFSLPIPFTVATLSLGQGVSAVHMLGMFFLLLHSHGVRLLHTRARLPIVPSIALPAIAYAVVATLSAPLVPRTESAFWLGAAAMMLLSLLVFTGTRHRTEPGHRTPLPLWVKLPTIVAAVALLILCKNMLQGFMTVFPMISLVAAYESRHSLWTMCRQVPAFTLCLVPMMAVMYVVEPRAGLPLALAAGWLAYLALMIPFTLARWSRTPAAP